MNVSGGWSLLLGLWAALRLLYMSLYFHLFFYMNTHTLKDLR